MRLQQNKHNRIKLTFDVDITLRLIYIDIALPSASPSLQILFPTNNSNRYIYDIYTFYNYTYVDYIVLITVIYH